jgi:hypothetical protein
VRIRRCRREAGNRSFPPRDLFSFPLPQELEPYRAETAARVAENPGFGWREWEETFSEQVASEQTEQSSIAQQLPICHAAFCRAAVDNLRQQSYADDRQRSQVMATEELAQCDIARDVLGYPGAKVEFNPMWRTDTAISLAKHMYESRDFGAMPILADALQDAGCDHDDILDHCRDTKQQHVRGCWVVDLVFGKE